MNSHEPLLRIQNLDITFKPKAHAVRSLNLEIDKSQIHGLVGESGSGKSVTSTAVIGLLPEPPAKINSGQIIFKGRDILKLKQEEKRKLRGREIAMVFQEPSKYLNPSLKIGEQIREG
ncbi:MAG: ABC transporter ATP-binding protein, partial [Spirochaetales bacterium]|nr:ABC transporter ATP-binding protein [Spirochaetales bacterium]